MSSDSPYSIKQHIRESLATSTSESLKQMRKARTELVLGVYGGMDESDMFNQRKRLQAWVIAAYMNLLPFRNSVDQWQQYTLWEEDGEAVPVDRIENMFVERERVAEHNSSRKSNPDVEEVPKIYPWQHLVAASKTLDELAGEAIMQRRQVFHAGDET